MKFILAAASKILLGKAPETLCLWHTPSILYPQTLSCKFFLMQFKVSVSPSGGVQWSGDNECLFPRRMYLLDLQGLDTRSGEFCYSFTIKPFKATRTHISLVTNSWQSITVWTWADHLRTDHHSHRSRWVRFTPDCLAEEGTVPPEPLTAFQGERDEVLGAV